MIELAIAIGPSPAFGFVQLKDVRSTRNGSAIKTGNKQDSHP